MSMNGERMGTPAHESPRYECLEDIGARITAEANRGEGWHVYLALIQLLGMQRHKEQIFGAPLGQLLPGIRIENRGNILGLYQEMSDGIKSVGHSDAERDQLTAELIRWLAAQII